MKSIYLLLQSAVVALTVAVVTPALFAAEPVQCPSGVLPQERLAATQQLRQKYFSACLACEGTRCTFRQFKQGEEVLAEHCPVLFCVPVSVGRAAFVPELAHEEGVFRFTYGISAEGRVADIEVTSIIGEAKPNVAEALIRNVFKRRVYAPIVVGGTTYALYNLTDGLTFTISRE